MFSEVITNPLIISFLILFVWALGCFFSKKTQFASPIHQEKTMKRKGLKLVVFLMFGFVLFSYKVSFTLLSLFSIQGSDEVPEVIVMMSGNSKENHNPEINFLNSSDLLRLSAAIWWQKQHPKATLIISGINKKKENYLEHLYFLREFALKNGLSAEQILLDDFSTNTFEHPIGIKKLGFDENTKLGLVSSFWHERRIKMSYGSHFKQFIFIPKKVFYLSEGGFEDYLPSSRGVLNIEILLHELIGLIYYKIKILTVN